MKECTNEFTLQAYFDGELPPAEMRRIAAHLAACRQCAAAAQEIEEETALLSLALADEIAAPVPTESLRARLDAAIATLEAQPLQPTPRLWQRVSAWFAGLNFEPQHAMALASVAIVATLGWFAWAGQPAEKATGADTLARLDWPQASVSPTPDAKPKPFAGSKNATPEPRMIPVKYTRDEGFNRKPQAKLAPEATPLPGEAGYLKTIASLEKAVASQQSDLNLQPKVRAVYERNIAVLDQAIRASQKSARRNPRDPDAADFLYSAYQSKVDLMNTVATSARPAIGDR
jgi:hypothetical protein